MSMSFVCNSGMLYATAGIYYYVAVLKRLSTPHFSVDYIFWSFKISEIIWIHLTLEYRSTSGW